MVKNMLYNEIRWIVGRWQTFQSKWFKKQVQVVLPSKNGPSSDSGQELTPGNRQNSSFLDCFLTQHAEEVIESSQKRRVGPKKNVNVVIKKPFLLHRLKKGPVQYLMTTREESQRLYREMKTVRLISSAIRDLVKPRSIRGQLPFNMKPEACIVGMKAALRKQDHVITASQSHNWAYVMNVKPDQIFAEVLGKQLGPSRGKGGPTHLHAKSLYSGSGVPGAQVSLGAGVALACKYSRSGGACLIEFNENESSQGQIQEVYNMAGMWKLPCVFVCENSKGANEVEKRQRTLNKLYTHGFFVPGVWVDSMDAFAVKSATDFALHYVQKRGPILLELSNHPHYEESELAAATNASNETKIREMMVQRDPLNNFKAVCKEYGLLDDQEIRAIDEDVSQNVAKAVKQAKALKEALPEDLTTDIYSHCLEARVRGINHYIATGTKKVTYTS